MGMGDLAGWGNSEIVSLSESHVIVEDSWETGGLGGVDLVTCGMGRFSI